MGRLHDILKRNKGGKNLETTDWRKSAHRLNAELLRISLLCKWQRFDEFFLSYVDYSCWGRVVSNFTWPPATNNSSSSFGKENFGKGRLSVTPTLRSYADERQARNSSQISRLLMHKKIRLLTRKILANWRFTVFEAETFSDSLISSRWPSGSWRISMRNWETSSLKHKVSEFSIQSRKVTD